MGSQSPQRERDLQRKREQYDDLCKQLAREDELYQKRLNFLIVLNLAMGAGVVSQFFENRLQACLIFSGFALLLNYSLASQIYEGKKQIHLLKSMYYNKYLQRWPRPFHADRDEHPTGSIRRVGRVVREFVAAWILGIGFLIAEYLNLTHING